MEPLTEGGAGRAQNWSRVPTWGSCSDPLTASSSPSNHPFFREEVTLLARPTKLVVGDQVRQLTQGSLPNTTPSSSWWWAWAFHGTAPPRAASRKEGPCGGLTQEQVGLTQEQVVTETRKFQSL